MRAFADVDEKLYYVKKENSGNRRGCGCGCVGMDTLLHTSVCWVAEQGSANNLRYFSFPGSLSCVLSGVTHHTHTGWAVIQSLEFSHPRETRSPTSDSATDVCVKRQD